MKKLLYIVLAATLMLIGGCNQQDVSDNPSEEVETVVETEIETSEESEVEIELVRETQFGNVKGYEDNNALIWMGVPYGGDTSGENRWKAPSDPEPWTDDLDTTEAGEVFLQAGDEGAIGSENALNLDIYRPNNDTEELPVMVFIHGGNNQTGHAQEISGASFVRNHDAIVVSVNYRLGVLGFNPLPALKTGTDEENSGNYALLDLSKSLDWVKENISSFGGDKDNITILGFSAGGRDVMAMLTSPIFEGKFHNAVTMSGGLTIADEENSQEVFASAFAPLVVEDGDKASLTEAEEWLLSTDEAVSDYLYELDGERLTTLMGNAGIRMSVFPHLYNDGVVIPEDGFDTTNFNSVPLMMLTGTQEFSLFGLFDPYFGKYHQNETMFTDESAIKQYEFVNKYGGQLYNLSNSDDAARKISASYSAPIYGMELLFGENPEAISEEMVPFGSFHGGFIPLLDADNQNYAGLIGDSYSSSGAKELSDTFQDYLFNFISTGNPNGSELVEWKEWEDSAEENILYLDATTSESTAEMGKKDFNYDDVLEAIDNDTTVTDEQKNDLLSQVLNGRWFSYELDKKYNNLSEFDK